MREFKVGQVWEHIDQYDKDNHGKAICFKINNITNSVNEIPIINGIFISGPESWSTKPGQEIWFLKNIMNHENWHLKQDRIGLCCRICDTFYNEATRNRVFNRYFRCWKCDI